MGILNDIYNKTKIYGTEAGNVETSTTVTEEGSDKETSKKEDDK